MSWKVLNLGDGYIRVCYILFSVLFVYVCIFLQSFKESFKKVRPSCPHKVVQMVFRYEGSVMFSKPK